MLNLYAAEYFPSTENRCKNDIDQDFTQEQKNHRNWMPSGKTNHDKANKPSQNQSNETHKKKDKQQKWLTPKRPISHCCYVIITS